MGHVIGQRHHIYDSHFGGIFVVLNDCMMWKIVGGLGCCYGLVNCLNDPLAKLVLYNQIVLSQHLRVSS